MFSASEIQFTLYEVEVSLQTCTLTQLCIDPYNLDSVVESLNLFGGESFPLN